MDSLEISPAQRRRIERLEQVSGRTPQSMLGFVLRDGIEATKQGVRKTIKAHQDNL